MAKPGPKPKDKKLLQEIFNSKFVLIKELMELGYPKYIACKKIGVSTPWFYKYATKEHIRILDEIYFSFSNGKYQKDL